MSSDNTIIKDSSEASPLGGGLVVVDLNCDLGEGIGNDTLIMPYISSANIACGYHAGDVKTIWDTLELAAEYDVAAGAHISFLDRENFGRKEMNLSGEEIYDLIMQQLIVFSEIEYSFGIKVRHVKPHGALYNMSAGDPVLARHIAKAVKDFSDSLILFGLSGSRSITEAKAAGLKTANEVFADRTYQDNGSLTPRSQPNALIEDENKAIQQVLQMVKEGTVTSVSGKTIPIVADTICIHGDGKHAVEFAQKIHARLKEEGISISSPK